MKLVGLHIIIASAIRFEKGLTYNLEKKYTLLCREIRLEFFKNMKRYGARRMQMLLAHKQIKLSRRIVGKIMREEGLIAI